MADPNRVDPFGAISISRTSSRPRRKNRKSNPQQSARFLRRTISRAGRLPNQPRQRQRAQCNAAAEPAVTFNSTSRRRLRRLPVYGACG